MKQIDVALTLDDMVRDPGIPISGATLSIFGLMSTVLPSIDERTAQVLSVGALAVGIAALVLLMDQYRRMIAPAIMTAAMLLNAVTPPSWPGSGRLGAYTMMAGALMCAPKAVHTLLGAPHDLFVLRKLSQLEKVAAEGSMTGRTYAELHRIRCDEGRDLGALGEQYLRRFDDAIAVTDRVDRVLAVGRDSMHGPTAHVVARKVGLSSHERDLRTFGCPIEMLELDVRLDRIGRLVHLCPTEDAWRIWDAANEKHPGDPAEALEWLIGKLETDWWNNALSSLWKGWEGTTADLIETVDLLA